MSRLLRRRPPLPPALVGRLAVGERVLASGQDVAGVAVVATDRHLWHAGPDEQQRIAWHEVAAAGWRSGTLTVTAVDPARPPLVLDLAAPGRLPEVVRERVTASIVLAQTHRVGDATVRVVARRDAATGDLVWSAVLGAAARRDDPAVQAAVDDLLARARESLRGAAGS